MRYDFQCNNDKCQHIEEIVCLMSEYDEKKDRVRCPKCKHKMERLYSTSNDGFVSGRTIGHTVDLNTDRMSLDEKINRRLATLTTDNELLKPEYRERDKERVKRQVVRQLTEAHNS